MLDELVLRTIVFVFIVVVRAYHARPIFRVLRRQSGVMGKDPVKVRRVLLGVGGGCLALWAAIATLVAVVLGFLIAQTEQPSSETAVAAANVALRRTAQQFKFEVKTLENGEFTRGDEFWKVTGDVERTVEGYTRKERCQVLMGWLGRGRYQVELVRIGFDDYRGAFTVP